MCVHYLNCLHLKQQSPKVAILTLPQLPNYFTRAGPACVHMMYACKLSQCCEDTAIHSNQTSVIFGVKIASEATSATFS